MSARLNALVAAAALTLTIGCASSKPADPEPMPQAPAAAEGPETAEQVTLKADVGKKAPVFSLTDTDGNTVSLADFAGKKVVLEWFNPGCPFVKYAHGEDGPLASLPAKYIEQGVVWLAINSGGEGKQGADANLNKKQKVVWGMDYPVLLDPTGNVGKMYGAKTTPHLFVIDEAGVLAYAGALDNAPLGELKGESAVNYIDSAMGDLAAGGKVSQHLTKPYGCSVKYAQ